MTQNFFYHQRLVIVPAIVTGNKQEDYRIMLAVDTGSFYTNIKPEMLRKIGTQTIEQRALLLGVGEKVEANFAILRSLRGLNKTLPNATVISHQLPADYPIDGLIGNDILQHYKLTIDYPNQIISIE